MDVKSLKTCDIGKRFLFLINTAGQAYTWRYCIDYLKKQGYQIDILARDHGPTLTLLKSFGFDFTSFSQIKSKNLKIFEIFNHLQNGYRTGKKCSASLLIGFGLDASLTGLTLHKPSIVFTDGELVPVQNMIIKYTSNTIVTPSCFRRDLGKKHIRVAGYKELAYLHPNYFQPDPSIFGELGIKEHDKYVIFRFCAFEAMHDIGRYGFSLTDKYNLVKSIEKYAKVFITAEGDFPPNLAGYKLPTKPNRIHHVLYYAQMLVGDSQTSTTEAAVLGTPAVRCNSFAGENDVGNFLELEKKYDLIYSFNNSERATHRAIELISQPDLKDTWAQKRQTLLKEKVDVTKFMTDLIENYSQ
jgi:predicted glycosyltransferase